MIVNNVDVFASWYLYSSFLLHYFNHLLFKVMLLRLDEFIMMHRLDILELIPDRVIRTVSCQSGALKSLTLLVFKLQLSLVM